MKTGRPPSWLLDPGRPGAVLHDVCRVDDRSRAVVPARLLHAVEWMRSDADSACLLVLDHPGAVIALSWDAVGGLVLKRREELMDGEGRDASEHLWLVDDRYCRGTIARDGRILLPEHVLGHLKVLDRADPWLYVRASRESIELWSPDYRNQRRRETGAILDGLP